MKIHKGLLILLIMYLSVSTTYSQNNPIEFINNSYTINIDTIHCKKFFAFNELNLSYKFENNGNQVTFVDTFLISHSPNQYITKPGATSDIELKFKNFFNNYDLSKSRDTSASIFIPFYYGNEIYYSELICHLKYGRGKLIIVDSTEFDITDIVTDFINNINKDVAKNTYPNFDHTIHIPIINISDDKINCTKELYLWADNYRNTVYNIIDLNQDNKYLLPVKLNMGRRYHFKRKCYFIVFKDDIIEPYSISIFSDYK